MVKSIPCNQLHGEVKPSISKKTIWGFPQMGVPPNHPKSDHFSIETQAWGYLEESTSTYQLFYGT